MPWAIALASSAAYALGLVLAQLGLRRQSPLAGASTSLPVTAATLWLLAAAVFRPQHFDWRGGAVFAGVGLVFPVAVTLLSFQSNRYLGPNLAGALGNATPLPAVVFATLILGERLTPGRAAGLLVVLAGVAMLSLRSGLDPRRWPAWALLLPLAAAVIRGLAQPLVKLGLQWWTDAFAATLISYTVSALVILGVAFLRGRARMPLWDRRAAPMFGLVGLCNGASVLLLYAALAGGHVTLVAPLVATYPLFTLLFSALLLRGERFHGLLLAGVAATVGGVALVLAG